MRKENGLYDPAFFLKENIKQVKVQFNVHKTLLLIYFEIL